MRRDVFQAIADPNRREIISLLSNEDMTLNEVASHFDISRPAISKHVKILEECGLIDIKVYGRERLCEVKLHKLKEVARWADQFRHTIPAKREHTDEKSTATKEPARERPAMIQHQKTQKQ